MPYSAAPLPVAAAPMYGAYAAAPAFAAHPVSYAPGPAFHAPISSGPIAPTSFPIVHSGPVAGAPIAPAPYINSGPVPFAGSMPYGAAPALGAQGFVPMSSPLVSGPGYVPQVRSSP